MQDNPFALDTMGKLLVAQWLPDSNGKPGEAIVCWPCAVLAMNGPTNKLGAGGTKAKHCIIRPQPLMLSS